MSRRKISRKIKKRRPRGKDARNADAQKRAASAAFQRWAMKPNDRDREAVEQAEKDVDKMLDTLERAQVSEEVKQNVSD
jgi:hypothetical protein